MPRHSATFLTELSATTHEANYVVNASTDRLTIGAVPAFTEAGPVSVSGGAGRMSMAVSAPGESRTLMAPVAPYAYLLRPG